MKYPPITLELLKSKKACQGQLDLFQTHFGDTPVPLTEEVFTKFSSEFDIGWAASNLLDSTDFSEYDKVRDKALTEYDKATNTAKAEYYKVSGTALTEYEKVLALARTEYYKATEAAYAEYDKVIALAFLTLYTA